jgi:hypothetical protein
MKRIRTILSSVFLVASILAGCTAPTPTAAPPTLPPPTLPPATATALPAPTAAPDRPTAIAPTYAPMPAFDPALYRPAMRAEFAADVDSLAGAPRYSIQVTVDLNALALIGREQVRYTNTDAAALNEVYLRLFPSAPGFGAAMTVTNVLVNGQPVTPQLEQQGTALRVPVSLAAGASAELALDFFVSIPRDPAVGYAMFGLEDGVAALPNFYPVIPVRDASGWHIEVAPAYGDETFNPTALYDVTITAPPGQTVVTSGSCEKTPGNSLHCVSGPMRDFMLALGADYATVSQTVDGVTVRSFFISKDANGGKRAAQVAADAVRVYARRFGAYPFAELDVIETATRAGGIEYPGLVVIAESLYTQASEGSYFDFVVAHEVAHQWWYSLVGDDQVNHPWLDEALAQYSTILYYEDTAGKPVADRVLKDIFETPYANLVRDRRDQKVDQPVAAFTESDYSAVVYRKGPLFFKALREAIGDDRFNAFLKMYFNQNRYGIATPERLLAAAESVADKATVRSVYAKWIESVTTP